MNFKRIGRMLVCLLLVCCLIVNISPVKAKAGVVSPLPVSAEIVIASVLLGLGVYATSETGAEALNNVVSSAREYLESTNSWISDGFIQVYSTGDMTKPYAIPIALIEALFVWLYASGVLSDDFLNGKSGTYLNDSLFGDGYLVSDIPFAMYWVENEYISESFMMCFSSESGYVHLKESVDSVGALASWHLINSYNGIYYSCYSRKNVDTSGWNLPLLCTLNQSFANGAATCVFVIDNYLSGIRSTNKDLTLGEVAPAGTAVADGYATWAEGAIDIPQENTDDEPVVVVPTGLSTGVNAGQELTQADVWAGVSTYVNTGGELDPGESDDTQTSGDLFTDITVQVFLSKLMADLTKALFGSGTQTLAELFGSTWVEIRSVGQTIVNTKSQLFEGLQTLFQTLTDSIAQIWDSAVTALLEGIAQIWDTAVTALLEGVKAIFVPSEDFLTAKVDAIRDEYAFADSIISTGEFIGNSLSGIDTSPPIIYIHLEDTRGTYDIGGTVPFIDMSWYEEYKPTADKLLSALLWIVFCWRIFLKLPGIISGMPGDFVMDGLNQIGLAEHLPSRKAGYEVQRMSNREQIRRPKR